MAEFLSVKFKNSTHGGDKGNRLEKICVLRNNGGHACVSVCLQTLSTTIVSEKML